MNKILLIIRREYLSRVRKKSFLIMTLIGPLLMASLFVAPVLISQMNDEYREVLVLDETGLFLEELKEKEDLSFEYLPEMELEQAKRMLLNGGQFGLLYIPCGAHCDLNYIEKSVEFFARETTPLGLKVYLKSQLDKDIERLKLEAEGVDLEKIERSKTSVNITTFSLESGSEEERHTEIATAVGFIAAFLIYLFIFLYGAQVMRGVIEEKAGRIIEVIISSVKPFQLMMGKILGIAAVGLTQFLLWILLTFAIITVAQTMILGELYDPDTLTEQMAQGGVSESDMEALQVFEMIDSINFPLIIGTFIFYFLFGYLLYGALFAAVGAAVDHEADTQQFMLPITVPLILAIIVGQSIIENPDSPIAFWFSIIPFTSPVVMMQRIATGVDTWELLLSMFMMILGFLGTVWVAGRIYRTGILMYGKKVSWAEMWKWVRYH
jgi:ABC-2 type transport system permease protein